MKNQSMFVAAIFASALSSAALAAQQPQSGSATPSGQPGQPGQAGQPTTATASANQSPSDKQTTLQGCLQKNKSGGYWLTMAANTPFSSTPSSGASGATGSASSQPGTVGTSGSATARPTDSASASAHQGMVYNLEEMDGKVGNMDLDKHVGHKVEVTGRVDDTKSSDQLKSGSAASPSASSSSSSASGTSAANNGREIDAQDFHIASIRMIDGNCN